MYYLRTKSAVDAIKFTLDNKAKDNPESEEVKALVAPVKIDGAVPVEPLSPQELKEIIAQAKQSEDDDCLMCGS